MKLDKKKPLILMLVLSFIMIFLLVLILLVVLMQPPSTLEPTAKENDSFYLPTSDGIHLDQESFSQRFGIGYTLVNDFGLDDYECTGSCTCETEERRTGATATRNVKYIVSAVSTVFALSLAKNKFNDGCRLEYKDSCSSGTIQSNVEDCTSIRKSPLDRISEQKSDFLMAWNERYYRDINELTDEEKELLQEDLIRMEDSMKGRTFLCKGNCVKGSEPRVENKINKKDVVEKSLESGIRYEKVKNAFHEYFLGKDCSEHYKEDEITVDTPSLEFLQSDQKIYGKDTRPHHFAMCYFEDLVLRVFCYDIGLTHAYDTIEKKLNVLPGSFDLPPGLCVGRDLPKHNPTISCTEVE